MGAECSKDCNSCGNTRQLEASFDAGRPNLNIPPAAQKVNSRPIFPPKANMTEETRSLTEPEAYDLKVKSHNAQCVCLKKDVENAATIRETPMTLNVDAVNEPSLPTVSIVPPCPYGEDTEGCGPKRSVQATCAAVGVGIKGFVEPAADAKGLSTDRRIDTESLTAIKKFISESARRQVKHQAQLMAFTEKAIGVLLAEALSSTAYQIISVAINGTATLSVDQALLARSIYAGFISIYSPCVAWALSKCARARQFSFLGIALRSHASVCPVLLAWGLKDFASQLDTWAGKKLWHEAAVAGGMTLIVVVPQAFLCYRQRKAAVAVGGPYDTLLSRFVIIPSSCLVTVSYIWNVVATYYVGKVQGLEAAPTFHFKFTVQFAYAVIACTWITMVSVALANCVAKQKAKAQLCEKVGDAIDPHGLQASHTARDWAGIEQQTCVDIILGILQFVYGWALLDTLDDFAFGVMFGCQSSASCSYQSNFVYAMLVTVTFVAFTLLLDRFKELNTDSARLSKAVDLQLTAMVLTVGWAWMNFYTRYMTEITSSSPFDNAAESIALYVVSDLIIIIFHSLAQFILQRTNQGLVLSLKQTIGALERTAEIDK